MKDGEGDKSLFVDSELLAPGKETATFAGTVGQWGPSKGGEAISSEKRSEIIDNMRRAFDFQNLPFEIF